MHERRRGWHFADDPLAACRRFPHLETEPSLFIISQDLVSREVKLEYPARLGSTLRGEHLPNEKCQRPKERQQEYRKADDVEHQGYHAERKHRGSPSLQCRPGVPFDARFIGHL